MYVFSAFYLVQYDYIYIYMIYIYDSLFFTQSKTNIDKPHSYTQSILPPTS